MTRIVVLTAPRSGTHFVVRSLAAGAAIPHQVTPYLPAPLPGGSWIIGTHDPQPDVSALSDAGVKLLIVERNPLDHVLSFFDHPKNANSLEFVTRVAASRFVSNRHMHARIDAVRFSYDLLATGDETEWERLSRFVGFTAHPEQIEQTRREAGELAARFGRPGRWAEVLSPRTADLILELLHEN